MDLNTSQRSAVILMAEDNPTDVMLTREALANAKLLNTLHVTKDGIEALEFLRRQGKYADAPRPDLILLDINMPRKGGLEVLAELKIDAELKNIPVIILTTSSSDEDVARAYGNHANCYISKPVDFDSFAQVVKSMQDFWFMIATLPTHPKN